MTTSSSVPFPPSCSPFGLTRSSRRVTVPLRALATKTRVWRPSSLTARSQGPLRKVGTRECFYEVSVFVDYEQAALADILLGSALRQAHTRTVETRQIPYEHKTSAENASAVVRPRPCCP